MGNLFCRFEIDEERDRLTKINLDFMERLDDLNEYEVVVATQPFVT